MSALLFVGVTVGAAVGALLLRPFRRIALVVALLGLLVALGIAAGMVEGTGIAIGDAALVVTAYARLVLVLATAMAIVAVVLAQVDDEPPGHAPATLAVIGGLGGALLVDEPLVGLLLVVAAGIAAILVVQSGERPSIVAAAAAMRSLRAVVVAGGLTIVAAAWLARPLGALALEPAVFGVAYLAMVGAVAMRAAVVPFHLWLVRLADAAPPATLPVFAVWIPVTLAVVVLGWVDRTIAPVLVPLETERAAVVVVGLACLALGSLAALLANDVVHLAVYATVAEAGLAMLGLTVLEPAVWQPFRSWLVAFAVAQTSLFGWVAALKAHTRSRQVAALGAVLASSRLLRLALALVALAAIGLPGWPIWEARARIVDLALGSGVAPLGLLAAFLPFAAFARLAVVGLVSSEAGGRGRSRSVDRVGAARGLAAAGADRGVAVVRGMAGARARWAGFRSGRVGSGGVGPWLWDGVRSGRFERAVVGGWRRHRTRVAAIGAVALAGLAVATSVGWLGVDAAAAGGPPSVEQTELLGGGLDGAP